MSGLTVGQLREALADRPADMPVVIPGGEYDYQSAVRVFVESVEWHEGDPDDEPEEGVPSVLCFCIVERHASYAVCAGCGLRNYDTNDERWNCPDFPRCAEVTA